MCWFGMGWFPGSYRNDSHLHPHTLLPSLDQIDSSPNSRNCDLTRVKERILDRKILSKSQKSGEGCIFPGLAVKGGFGKFHIPLTQYEMAMMVMVLYPTGCPRVHQLLLEQELVVACLLFCRDTGMLHTP